MHSYINFARFKRKMFWPDDIFLINLGEFSPEIKYAYAIVMWVTLMKM